jgi:hypothetical protein
MMKTFIALPLMRFLPSAIVLLDLALICLAPGEFSATNHPFSGIACYAEKRSEPPMQLFVAEIDLANPKLHLRVSPGGADPDGPGPWQTTLMQPTKIAARDGMDFVINGDFFDANLVKDAEGTNSGYRAGQWASVIGPAVTDGKTWATNATGRPSLVVHKNGKVTIETVSTPSADALQVVAGNKLLVKDGIALLDHTQTRHPRTVVGLDATGTKLTILLVDGRKPGVAVGMSYDELAAEMLRLGCQQALNLDGGGSSVMAIRDSTTGTFKTLNEPTDGHERAVADVLEISVENSERAQQQTNFMPHP